MSGDPTNPADGAGSDDTPSAEEAVAASEPASAGDWDEAAASLVADQDGTPAEGSTPVDGELSVEGLVLSLEQVTAERDELIQARMRQQADFENTKKQMLKRQTEQAERANESLAGSLLEVLDAMDAAKQHAAEAVEPLHTKLLDVLGKAGLTAISAVDEAFDPTLHEAVMHEEGEGTEDGASVVAEVLRTGYAWKGRTLRPAMVKVRG